VKVLVTGATGFIGGNLTRALLDRGYTVRALVRRGSDRHNLRGLDAEPFVGDLTEPATLEPALRGCEGLFHVAASYTFWTPDPARVYGANVTGTENILSAAARADVSRIVYTSSESTLDITGDEPVLNARPEKLPGHYKRSKCLAEGKVLAMAGGGLPVVVVNPTTPIGEHDIKPTPTGRIIIDYLNGKMPAFVNTGLNVIDVRDVAAGHILAMEKGTPGERYVLGNRNVTLRELFLILEELTGIKAPRYSIPLWTALAAGYFDEFFNGKLRGREPRIPVDAVRAAHRVRFFDCSKAVAELGLPQTPVEKAFQRAINWFMENGYARGAREGAAVGPAADA
jgi:dihydroflavonol-4-reductase